MYGGHSLVINLLTVEICFCLIIHFPLYIHFFVLSCNTHRYGSVGRAADGGQFSNNLLRPTITGKDFIVSLLYLHLPLFCGLILISWVSGFACYITINNSF